MMKRHGTGLLVAYLVLGLLSVSVWAGQRADGAAGFVKGMGEQVITLVSASDMSSDSRRAALEDLLRRGVGVESVSAFVVADHWDEASPEERARFQEVFSDYLVAAYMRIMVDAEPKSFVVTSSRDIDEQATMVATRIGKASGEMLELSWIIQQDGGSYAITDVLVEGVSQARTYRSEFAGVASRKGVDGLTEALARKVKK